MSVAELLIHLMLGKFPNETHDRRPCACLVHRSRIGLSCRHRIKVSVVQESRKCAAVTFEISWTSGTSTSRAKGQPRRIRLHRIGAKDLEPEPRLQARRKMSGKTDEEIAMNVKATWPSATIKLFLIHGDARRLRTAEISNWNGKALAAPRTELDQLLEREELSKPGVYFLLGTNTETGTPHAYIGEAEELRSRLKSHKSKEFWISGIVFLSKDENLTKAHIRYLEGRLIEKAKLAARHTLENDKDSGAKLPESDIQDMEVFLEKVEQLLPVLGTDILVPIPTETAASPKTDVLTFRVREAAATGQRTETGLVVFKESTAMVEERKSAEQYHSFVLKLRQRLVDDLVLVKKGPVYMFTKDHEFNSPSSAASVIAGGGTNGLKAWKYADGSSIKDREGE
jgi:hypothetical protein